MNELPLTRITIDWSRIGPRSYLRNIKAICGIDQLDFEHPVTFFVGENGSGKSTLLEGIAVAYGFNPEGGTKNYNFSTYDSHSELCDAVKVSRGPYKAAGGYFLRAESFYNVATMEEEYSRGSNYGSQYYHKRSHGESFLKLVKTSFRPRGIYLLDEPEAALSPQNQLTLLLEMARLSRQGAQFIVATHSPILLALPDAGILSFDDGALHPCGYEDTGSYQVMSLFINNRENVLHHLLEDDLSSES
nr:AAA family ATPase [Lachnospiraceae bacterium]